jgi:hypothetical protein
MYGWRSYGWSPYGLGGLFEISSPLTPEELAQIDNYKSKLARSLMPPPFDNRLASNIGKLLTVIGTGDNDIGGLFGEEDFLPDEEVE